MKVIITGDHAGMTLRNEVKSVLDELGYEYEDTGADCTTSVDYPDYALPAAKRVASGEFDRGIFICGTGIGISISANKVKGIRCALTHDVFSAKATRQHNDSNVLAMGERVIGPGLAREIVKTWLTTEFEGGRHLNRIDKISAYENE
ncbi:ribose 5-phosphate isomerase B [Pseudogracilibacillus auburnensis]|uniref:Ribose-5-phosphate isomerase n=1 Tax=Pseudogracilibacillus auburnensis TaxID=1494959 RepID=A0A2V3W001_9BACI|nr:ribose 5-phosphate isomerase B [Pseudogracilibacillus auburnensis]PXW87382.1 ribose-5-phosphate isomerase [Pseudogracilibacillus auburnensis]